MSVKTLEAAAILAGTTIGAGILGLPFIAAKAGFLTALLVIIVLGIVVLYLNLMLGEIALSSSEVHQLTGLANLFLGRNGKRLMAIALMVGAYGAILAYLIGIGKTLTAIFNGPAIVYSLIVWLLVSFLVFKGIDLVAGVELAVASFVVLLVIVMGLASLHHINISNLAVFDVKKIFLPFGVVLFAFSGFAAIPEMVEELNKDRDKLKKSVLIGFSAPFLLYLLFPFYVVGVTGVNTTEVATVGLGNALGEAFNVFGNLFAFLAMLTSFIALSFALFEMYLYNFNFKKPLSLTLSTLLPLAMFLIVSNIARFHQVLNYTGAITGTLTAIVLVAMLPKARQKRKTEPNFKIWYKNWVGLLIALFFVLGSIAIIVNPG